MIKTKIKNSMYLCKALFLSILTTLAFLLIISILLRFTNLKETSLPLLNNIVIIVSIVLGSLYISINAKENGWINGALVGFFYYVFIIIVNMIFIRSLRFDMIFLAKFIASTLIGAIGGIIGINLS